MMKLAFCLFTYFPYGGLQRDFLRIARACQALGHEIHVYTMRWEGEIEPGFHLHLVQCKGWQNHTRIASFVEHLKVLFRTNPYDLVIGFNKMPLLDLYYAADVCYQARIRDSKTIFSRILSRYQHYVSFEEAVFKKQATTEIMLISPLQKEAFVKYYQTEVERFHLLPPGIAKDRMLASYTQSELTNIQQEIRSTFKIAKDHYLLLMVGSGFKTKGLDRSIRALSSLPENLKDRCHLLVIGQDNSGIFLKLARQLKVDSRIQFLGGREDVTKFLLTADLLLHPAYHENTGTVLLEAAISGLPVLTTDVCGYANYINDANMGFVLKTPFEQAKLNRALCSMLKSPDPAWRENALEFAKNADIYRMPEVATALIEKIAQKKKIEKNANNFSFLQFSFEEIMQLRGEIFRQQKGRLTQRITIGNHSYFIKQHSGVGFKEVIKNLIQLRLPIVSAKNEWRALTKLDSLGINVPKVIAYAQKGLNPARLQSYIVLQELTSMISLEELTKDWQKAPPNINFKKALIKNIAHIARTLHQNGINHRDFYLCHFLWGQTFVENSTKNVQLYLIDLHRAALRSSVPKRWILKDLAALLFSSQHIQLTQHDFFLFMKTYHADSLRNVIKHHKKFWRTVFKWGNAYRDHTRAR